MQGAEDIEFFLTRGGHGFASETRTVREHIRLFAEWELDSIST
jgi:hypothetical protein